MATLYFSLLLASACLESSAFTSVLRPRRFQLKASLTALGAETYLQCGKCKAVYDVDSETLGRGKKVQCTVCDHSWWQTPDRLQYLREGWEMVDMADEKLQLVQENMAAGRDPNAAKYVKPGEVTVFIGNLPFEYGEEEIEGLFTPFGEVNGVTVVKLPDGRSKGYAFVEMAKKEAGEQAIEKMNGMDYQGRNLNVARGGKE
eukprot:CAMPEP_0172616346 /NCGR_PEP_ID=MMETSP1068-20121228/63829_1 /TAXON_ID=35684 /ORGANISM="Pseudopedinella elastica, Strain CCMP716" /LENGTH=201 /DNA_ID=CAMNT_0013421743 /DNA_START=58 /DNA_END=666 /DNA_ORIENTATION=+